MICKLKEKVMKDIFLQNKFNMNFTTAECIGMKIGNCWCILKSKEYIFNERELNSEQK